MKSIPLRGYGHRPNAIQEHIVLSAFGRHVCLPEGVPGGSELKELMKNYRKSSVIDEFLKCSNNLLIIFASICVDEILV